MRPGSKSAGETESAVHTWSMWPSPPQRVGVAFRYTPPERVSQNDTPHFRGSVSESYTHPLAGYRLYNLVLYWIIIVWFGI
jgi:hypothetical protein